MNKIFYTFVLSALVLLSVQCNPKSQESDEQIENDSIIEYAELLSITRHDDYTDVKISNPWDSTRLLHRYILVPKTQNVPSNLPQGTIVRTPLSNTLVYASVHCSLLEQLDALSQIGGVCDLSYIKTPALLSRAENGKLTGCHLIISFRKCRIRTYRENGNTHYRMRRLFGNFTSGPGRMDKILRSVIR